MKRIFTVYYREQNGEVGNIDFSEEFKSESELMQADLLNDVIHDLILVYNDTLKKSIDGMWEIYKAKAKGGLNAKISRKESGGKRWHNQI